MKTTIKKVDLAESVKNALATTKSAGMEAVETVFTEIAKALAEGNTVEISGFGKFEVTERSARTGINPATKEKIEIPASVTTIGSGAFHDCSSLEIVSFEEGSKLITIKDGYKDGGNTVYGAFTNCDNLTLFDASNCTQIKTIGNYAFNYRNRWNSQISFTIKLGTEIPPILTYTKDEYYTQLLILIAEIVNT